MKRPKKRYLAVIAGVILTLVCCIFMEGKSLSVQKTSAPANSTPLLVLRYEDIVPQKGSKNALPLSQLQKDIETLCEKGYTFVNSDDLSDFARGLSALPQKAVWLTFDGGHESFYQLVYPLLQEQGVKADVNVVGSYTDLYSQNLDTRERGYLSWMQLAQLDASPLIAVGNMSYDLNEKKLLGRKGAAMKKKEDPESYRSLLCSDVLTLQQAMNENLSHDSRVFCYPYGAYCEESEKILCDELGFLITLTCDEGMNTLTDKSSLRLLKRYTHGGKQSSEDFLQAVGVTE